MGEVIKYIWMFLFFMFAIDILMKTPIKQYHQDYINELNRIRSIPQKRIEATYRYIEAVENGSEDVSNGILTEPPKKYYIDSEDEEFYKITTAPKKESKSENKYTKPLYVRDKDNPQILHPYPYKQ